MNDSTALLGHEPPSRAASSGPAPGAHGAFTWGVLDALLQHPRLHFEGLSGGSAGAMNAVLLAYGPFLERLRAQGHERGAAWLAQHAASVGRQSTLDIQRHFG